MISDYLRPNTLLSGYVDNISRGKYREEAGLKC